MPIEQRPLLHLGRERIFSEGLLAYTMHPTAANSKFLHAALLTQPHVPEPHLGSSDTAADPAFNKEEEGGYSFKAVNHLRHGASITAADICPLS